MNLNKHEKVSSRMSVYTVYILALFCFMSPPIVYFAELFLLVSVSMDWKISVNLFQTLYGKIFLIFIPLALLSAIWASMTFGYTDSQFEQALDYIHMSLFVVAGWVIYRNSVNLRNLFIVLIAGLIISLITHIPAGGYQPIIEGSQRLRIGTIHPIQLGTYTAAITIGVVIWLVSNILKESTGLMSSFGSFILFNVFLILMLVLMMTGSRGAFLGFVLAVVMISLVKLVLMKREKRHVSRKIIGILIMGIISISIVASLTSDKTIDRIYSERGIIHRIITGDIENIPKTSIGWRVRMNEFAWKKFSERPILGWGPYVKQVIDNSDLGLPWGHVHNSYWEVLLRFGIVGGVLFGAGIIWLIRGVWLDYRNHPDEEPVMLSLYGAFIVLAVWALIDYKFTGWENTAFIWLLGGAAASRALRAKFETDTQ